MVWAGGDRTEGSGRGRHRQGLEPHDLLGEGLGREFRDEDISENEATHSSSMSSLLLVI